MKNRVILYLTSPKDVSRMEMCLTNFKQLEKLGYDIITLTTADLLPDYIYHKSKCVIHDYTKHVCRKKMYYQFANLTNLGYYFIHSINGREVRLFQDTHFPSLLRNLKTLVKSAEALGYDKYFYTEDDHFFHDIDLDVIQQHFDYLENSDLIVFSFKRYTDPTNDEMVYGSYFHFGRTEKVSKLTDNFAYTASEFEAGDAYVYLNFYEYVFTTLINMYKRPDLNVLDIKCLKNGISDAFPHSKLNMIYSIRNIADDGRCNIIYDMETGKNVFFYSTNWFNEDVNMKLYIGDVLVNELTMKPGWWFVKDIADEDVNNTYAIFNNEIKKSFQNQILNDIIYNGVILK